MELNLQAKTKEQQRIKAYLEENASEILADKINNGVHIQKNGKTLLNKKTLDGFMKFACDEAKKQAEKGASCACIEDDVVFGWAVHYFEEDSVEGTLYDEDGGEYRPGKVVRQSPAPSVSRLTKEKAPQMSLFDILDTGSASEGRKAVPTTSKSDFPAEEDINGEDEEPTEKERREILAEAAAEEERERVDDGKHWVDDTTYIDEDGVVHDLDEEDDNAPDFDPSAFDTEALAVLDELLGEQIEMR